MDSGLQSPIRLALKILSPQYRRTLGEDVTSSDVEQIRSWAGQGAENMSAMDAASLVLCRELTRSSRVQ